MSVSIFLLSAVVFFVPGVVLIKRATLGRRRVKSGCWRCKFSLEGLPADIGRCPECGTLVVPRGKRPPTTRRERVVFAMLGLLCLLPGIHMVLAGMLCVAGFPLAARLAPGLIAEESQEWKLQESWGRIARTFAAGGSSKEALRRAMDGLTQFLASRDRRLHQRSWQGGAYLVSGSYGSEPIREVAAALDTRTMSADQFGVLFDAVVDAYGAHGVAVGTAVDDVLMAMLAGEYSPKSSAGSGDYSPTEPPRTLTEPQTRRLIDLVLTVQSDRSRPWNARWGIAIERAYDIGRVPEKDIRRYLEQAVSPVLQFDEGDIARRGDVIDFRLDLRLRMGTNIPCFARVRSGAPPLEGRTGGEVCSGTLTMPGQGLYGMRGLLFLPDIEGPIESAIDVVVTMGSDVIDAHKGWASPWHHSEEEPAWRELPRMAIVKQAAVSLKIVPSDAKPTTEAESGPAAADVAKRLTSTGVWFDCSDVDLTVPSVFGDAGFDAFLRQDGREFPLGWTFVHRIGPTHLRYSGRAAGIDVSRPVDVVLRSNTGPIERAFWAPTIWKGEVVVPGVVGRHRALPDGWAD